LADCKRTGNERELRTEDKNKGNVLWGLRRDGIFRGIRLRSDMIRKRQKGERYLKGKRWNKNGKANG
jgi:hypothetical protein